MNWHRWVESCRAAREATCYLFVCLLMENKPGEMKCFAWKIDFSLPGNKLSVPHWPFDLLCLFEFAEVSHFILDTFRHGTAVLITRKYSFPTVSHLLYTQTYKEWTVQFNYSSHQRYGWSLSKMTNIYHHVSASWFHRSLHTASFRADTGGLALFHRTVLLFPSHLLRPQVAVPKPPSAFFNRGFDRRLNLVAVQWWYHLKSIMSPFVNKYWCNINVFAV